jgi:hypothetical protein
MLAYRSFRLAMIAAFLLLASTSGGAQAQGTGGGGTGSGTGTGASGSGGAGTSGGQRHLALPPRLQLHRRRQRGRSLPHLRCRA